jgi:hypothetical protein
MTALEHSEHQINTQHSKHISITERTCIMACASSWNAIVSNELHDAVNNGQHVACEEKCAKYLGEP